jgi:Protein of unknown function DUF115
MTDAEAPLVFETPGGLSVRYRGRLLYSGRDPAKLPRRVAGTCDRGPSRLLLVPSPLLWYGVPELLAAMGEGSAVLCVEADPALFSLARSRMPEQLRADGRLVFLELSSTEGTIAAASAMGDFRSCSLVPLSGGESLNASLYRAVADSLGDFFESGWRNRAALMTLGPRWASNILDNLAALTAIDPSPPPRFPGAVVVCGAGPSLESALPFVAEGASSGRLGVVACDTALGSLLASGIEPDLVVCLEAQAYNLGDFTCAGSRPLALAADLSSHPATFRAVRGPKHLSFVRITRSPFLDRVEAALRSAGIPFLELPPLGSVGVHAFRLARLLSDGPILAAGLDFSFETGKTHARGCPSLLAEEGRLDRLTRWPAQFAVSFRDRNIRLDPAEAGSGDAGLRLLTDPILLSYAALLSDTASAGASGPGLYDIRGRGPSIGMRRVTLDRARALVEASPLKGPPGASSRGCGPAAGGPQPDSAAAIASFLRGEAARLEGLRKALRGGTKVPREELSRLVAEVDYLYWGFPDQRRAGDLAQDFLNRLVPQLEYRARRIEGLL